MIKVWFKAMIKAWFKAMIRGLVQGHDKRPGSRPEIKAMVKA